MCVFLVLMPKVKCRVREEEEIRKTNSARPRDLRRKKRRNMEAVGEQSTKRKIGSRSAPSSEFKHPVYGH